MEPLKQKVQVEPDNVVSTFRGLRAAAQQYADEVEGATGLTGGLLSRIKTLAKSGKAWLVGTLAVGIAAVTAGIAKATGMAITFENQLNETRKTAALNNRQFGELRDRLLDVQAELGVARKDLANIAAQAGRLGIKGVDNIATFTRTVALMSEATAATADQSAQSLAKVLNAFNLPIERAQELAAVFNTLSNNTVATAGDVADATRRIGAAGAMLGITADEAAALGATLIDAGFRVEKAGTRMRIIMTRIQSKADEVGQVMDMTGQEVIEAFEERGVDALKQFLSALEQLPTAQRASVVRDIFGVRDVQTIQSLIDNTDDLNRNLQFGTEQMEDASSLQKEMAITTKDVANEWGRLTSKLSSWVTSFGASFTGMLESSLSLINDILGGVREITRDLSDAQRRIQNVQDTRKLLTELQKAEKGTERYNSLVKQLSANVSDAFVKFDEHGRAVGIRIEALSGRLERMADTVGSDLLGSQTEAIQQLNQEFLLLQRWQAQLESLDPGTEAWVKQQEAIQEAQSNIERLVQSIGATLPDNIQKARKEFSSLVEDTSFTDPRRTFAGGELISLQTLDEQQSFFFSRLRRLREQASSSPDVEGTPDTGDTGGGGDGSGLPDQQLSRAKEAAQELDSILTEVQRAQQSRNALTDEQAQKLKEIFETRDRIEKLVDRRRKLEAEAAGATGERKQRFLELVNKADKLVDRERTRLKILKEEADARREELEEIEQLEAAPMIRSADAVAAAESFAERLQSRVNAMGDHAGGEQILELLGVDLETFNQQFDHLEKQFQNQEITQAQFYDRARALASKYKGEIGTIIDEMERMGLVTSDQADRMQKGLSATTSQVQSLKTSLTTTILEAEKADRISTSTATAVMQALQNVDSSVLKGADSFEEIIRRLREMGKVSKEEAKETKEGVEESEEAVVDLGNALQDSARLIRGIGDLADEFGDLSDEAEDAIDATASVMDNVGRLIELSDNAGGFSDLFSSASGAFSGIGAIVGAAGGLVSLISASMSADEKHAQEMTELRKKIDDNVAALQENTQAMLEQARVGQEVPESAIDRANEIISRIVSSEFSNITEAQQDRLLSELERLAPMFEGAQDLLNSVESYFVQEAPHTTGGGQAVSDSFMRQLAREFLFTDASAQDIVDTLYENIGGTTVGGLGVDELQNRFGDDFTSFAERLAEIENQFGEFGDSMQGLIEELNFRRQELGASFEDLTSVLSSRLSDLSFAEGPIGQGAPDTFTEVLQERIQGANQEQIDQLRQMLAESFAGDRDLSFLRQKYTGMTIQDLLGDVTPSEFQSFIDQLGTLANMEAPEGEGQGGFSTSATVSRTITEHQANQLLAYQQELVQVNRERNSYLEQLLVNMGGPLPPFPSGPNQQSSDAPLSPSEMSDLSTVTDAVSGRQGTGLDGSEAILAETIEVDMDVYAEETPEEVARKLDEAIRTHLRRRSQ